MSTLIRFDRQHPTYREHPRQLIVEPEPAEYGELRKRARMSLFGSFHLQGPNDENLTPRGQKAQALLALVALAARGERSRVWLCSKLWSDSPAEQAYASLRQCLSDIRRALGIYCSSIMLTHQFKIAINFNNVTIDAIELHLALSEKRRRQYVDVPREELLEGLNVVDEEFEEWLTMERSRWANIRDELDRNYIMSPAATLAAASSGL